MNEQLNPNDPYAMILEEFLLRFRNGYCTETDWEYIRDIASRDTVSGVKWEPFKGGDVKEISKFNIECLQKVRNPIVNTDDVHIGDVCKSSANKANGLKSKLLLCKKYFVLLTKKYGKVL